MQINNEARRGGTDRQTHTHKNDYRNPPAHAPRVNYPDTVCHCLAVSALRPVAVDSLIELIAIGLPSVFPE